VQQWHTLCESSREFIRIRLASAEYPQGSFSGYKTAASNEKLHLKGQLSAFIFA
jgi:hypothetical protein